MSDVRPRKVAIPRLLHVGSGCLGEVGPLLAEHDFDLSRVLVGSGPGPSRELAQRVMSGLTAQGVDAVHRPGLKGRLDEAAATAAVIIEEGITTAVAVGGGRAIDPIKLAAARTRIEFISVPTTISNDGISSPVASLVAKDGTRASHAARMPGGIVVDVDAVAGAPIETIRAGAGDLISNLTACMDWRLAEREGRDRYDAFSAMIAEAAARPVLELEDVTSATSHELLAQGLLLSGLAMATAGSSRPCSGSEHLVSHALDERETREGQALHGEQVALGCLVSAAAHGVPLHAILRQAFARLGLPTRPEDVGLSRDDLVEALLVAPSMRPQRWTILSQAIREDGDAARLVDAAFYDTAEIRRSTTRSVARPSSRWQNVSRNRA